MVKVEENKEEVKEIDNAPVRTFEDQEHINEELILIPDKSDDDYAVYFNKDTQKYVRKMKFKSWATVSASTPIEKIRLYEKLNSEDVVPMDDAINIPIKIENIIVQSFDRINEDTGIREYGATTALISDTGDVYATSSNVFLMKLQEIVFSLTNKLEYHVGEFGIIISAKKVKSPTSKYKMTSFDILEIDGTKI